jgi:hypothetical protein
VALASNFARTNDEAKKLTRAAIDLSAATGMSLDTAVEGLGKTLTGTTGRLGQAVPILKQFTEQQLKAGAAIQAVAERFSGSENAKINTFSGAMKQLNNVFGDFLETIGNLVVKSPVVREVIKFISLQFIQLASSITKVSASTDIVGEIIKVTLQWGLALNQFVVKPLEFIWNLAKFVFTAIQSGIQTLVTIWANQFSALFTVIGKFTNKFDGIKDTLNIFAQSSGDVLKDFTKNSQDAFSGLFTFDFTAQSQDFLTKLSNVAQSAVAIGTGLGQGVKAGIEASVQGISFQNVVDAMNDAKNKIIISADEIAKNLNTSFIGGVTSAFSAFGGALAKGENFFLAFGKAVLGAMGQLLIQFGGMLVAVGIGLSTVPFLFGLQGPAAITAGIAAIIAGGALMALAGGAGKSAPATSGASAGGGGVASGTSSPIGDSASSLTKVERKEPETKINVNIAGSVLGDKRTLGREIADAINEAFGSDGITIARGALV